MKQTPLSILSNKHLYFDGGLGTLLQEKGLQGGELPERWNITNPDCILAIHKDYLLAGANIIKTNTFGANSLKFENEEELVLIIQSAISLAKQAIDEIHLETGRPLEEMFIAFDIGPLGKLLKPLGDLAFEDAIRIFSNSISIASTMGIDAILIETLNDTYEAKAAILAAKECCDVPLFVTTVYDEDAKLLTGGTPASVVPLLEGLGVDALGINCSLGPLAMLPIIKELERYCSLPLIANPNAGLPHVENGVTSFDVDPNAFATQMKELANAGAVICGGCCGTTPAHIKEMINVLDSVALFPTTKKQHTMVTSSMCAVDLSSKPILIGERINPTGKKRFKEALRANDLSYILNEALSQVDANAHILDVNVGLPEIDEASMLSNTISMLQATIDTPLQIDTSNHIAMEQALRLYNGIPLINSVNGKESEMQAIFPLIKKYGGIVVALCLDEDGIPETSAGRLAIAKKIYQTAMQFGIPRHHILIDALCMTVSSNPKAALVTLETVSNIKAEGGLTILGVSNISFGLPNRDLINSTFFTLALQAGLSCAIINPHSASMMNAYYSFLALTNQDKNFLDYINHSTATIPDTTKSPSSSMPVTKEAANTLCYAIERGLKEKAIALTQELLLTTEPLVIIEDHIMVALNHVGEAFEKKTLFLPQLLMSAEAAKESFSIIQGKLSKDGIQTKSKGTIVLATVKGDIHDIGKNIVKILLENYGFHIVDLGKDVEPALIVEAAKQHNVKLIGLSALMTTTVVYMEETIRLLQETLPTIKVMVGGAVLTDEYAKQIHADFYGKDALSSVRYATEIYEQKN